MISYEKLKNMLILENFKVIGYRTGNWSDNKNAKMLSARSYGNYKVMIKMVENICLISIFNFALKKVESVTIKRFKTNKDINTLKIYLNHFEKKKRV